MDKILRFLKKIDNKLGEFFSDYKKIMKIALFFNIIGALLLGITSAQISRIKLMIISQNYQVLESEVIQAKEILLFGVIFICISAILLTFSIGEKKGEGGDLYAKRIG